MATRPSPGLTGLPSRLRNLAASRGAPTPNRYIPSAESVPIPAGAELKQYEDMDEFVENGDGAADEDAAPAAEPAGV
jgi:hypothetical protein